MDIQTKYNVEDEVFILLNNKVHQEKIKRIEVFSDSKLTNVKYFFSVGGQPRFLEEDEVFETKEELLNSL